ncbi:MAG: hypothetical protein J6X28_05570 [Bacilli bacterium]|nr:hypothetical protein [Bacilli bacterium]
MGLWQSFCNWISGRDAKEADVYANYGKVEQVTSDIRTIATTGVGNAQDAIYGAFNALNNVNGLAEYVGSVQVENYDTVFESLASTINGIADSIDSKAQDIKTYEEASPLEKLGSSVVMGACKIGEGLLSVVEDVGDAALSVVGWIAPADSGLENWCKDAIEAEWSHDAFNFYYDSEFAKKSTFTEKSGLAGTLYMGGKIAGYMAASIGTAGALGLGTNVVAGSGLLSASGGTIGGTIVAGVTGLGNRTETALREGQSFDEAFGSGVKGAVGDAAVAFAAGKVAEKAVDWIKGIKGAKTAAANADDVIRTGVDSTDDVLRLGADNTDDILRLGSGSADDITRGMIENADDMAKAAAGSSDDVLRLTAGEAIENTDDVIRAGMDNVDDIIRVGEEGFEDIVRISGDSVDDIIRVGADNADDIARAAAGSSDDVARAVANNADDVVRAGLENADDVIRVGEKGFEDIVRISGDGLDDVVRAGAENLDDVARGVAGGGVTSGVDVASIITANNHTNDGEGKIISIKPVNRNPVPPPTDGQGGGIGTIGDDIQALYAPPPTPSPDQIDPGNTQNDVTPGQPNGPGQNTTIEADETPIVPPPTSGQPAPPTSGQPSPSGPSGPSSPSAPTVPTTPTQPIPTAPTTPTIPPTQPIPTTPTVPPTPTTGELPTTPTPPTAPTAPISIPTPPGKTTPGGIIPTQPPEPTHSGGGYGSEGYIGGESAAGGIAASVTDVLDDAEKSIDEIIKGSKYSRIPTSQKPISATGSGGTSSVIPIAAGLTVASAAGLGAKAYLDHKKAQAEEEEDEYGEEDEDFVVEGWTEDGDTLAIGEDEEDSIDTVNIDKQDDDEYYRESENPFPIMGTDELEEF